ncbi:acetyltransferase [Bdellovibrio sp. HCB337]|uniref:acetyltransferase n=1 Tax=Bdellovibrio sp. HCB337 TaxID=3394358 RepID=UPI0039A612F0
MDKVVIFGMGGHGRVVADALKLEGRYELVGFVDRQSSTSSQGKVLSEPELVASGIKKGVVAIGDNFVRAEISKKILQMIPDFEFVRVFHPRSSVSPSAVIGPGTVVLDGAVVGPFSKVGSHVILNTRSSVDHDGVLGDFASLAPGVTCGGGVVLGEYCAIGLGANLIHNVKLQDHVVVGAGATVLEDLPGSVVAYGNPCKVIRSRAPGEKYL